MDRIAHQGPFPATEDPGSPKNRSRLNAWEIAKLLEETETESGKRFVALVESSPILLVFLRHAGCPFCREALSDIAKVRTEIEQSGTRIVLVHMGDRVEMRKQIVRYGLSDLEIVCDNTARLYEAFGLKSGALWQILGLKEWIRGFVVSILQGHGIGIPTADLTQMPGVFFIDKGMVVRRYKHKRSSDRPNYKEICERPENEGKEQ